MSNTSSGKNHQHQQSGYSETDIAVVGLALRVPGASTSDEFWDNLRTGIESIYGLSEEGL
jgi:acyl transferase domain-containing protein